METLNIGGTHYSFCTQCQLEQFSLLTSTGHLSFWPSGQVHTQTLCLILEQHLAWMPDGNPFKQTPCSSSSEFLTPAVKIFSTMWQSFCNEDLGMLRLIGLHSVTQVSTREKCRLLPICTTVGGLTRKEFQPQLRHSVQHLSLRPCRDIDPEYFSLHSAPSLAIFCSRL